MIKQALNRRNTVLLTAFGETKTQGEWARDSRCNVKTAAGLMARIKRGMNHEDAITTPTISGHPTFIREFSGEA